MPGDKDLISDEEKYKNIISSMSQGFALHEIIVSNDGKPINYKFLEINDPFQEIIGKKRDDIIGKTVREVLPDIEDYWIENYGEVALSGQPKELEHFSKELKKYFKINAYSPLSGQFAVIATDITNQKNTELFLSEKTNETEKLNSFMMGRETKMIELKEQIEDLKLKLAAALKKDI